VPSKECRGRGPAGTDEVGTEEVGTDEVGTEEVGTEEVGTDEVGTAAGWALRRTHPTGLPGGRRRQG